MGVGVQSVASKASGYQGASDVAAERAAATTPVTSATEAPRQADAMAAPQPVQQAKQPEITLPGDGAAQAQQGKDAAQTEEQQNAQNVQIRKAVDEINKKAVNSEAVFGIHEKTNRVMIKIIDKDTKEVIKEYPPEKTLDMIAKLWEIAGLIVDEKR